MKRNKPKIITITYSNIDKPDGPVIHFMELWNSFSRQFGDKFEILGFGCNTKKGKPPIFKSEFPIKTITSNLPRVIRLFAQDLWFAFVIIRYSNEIIYLRTGNNMFFAVIAALLFKPLLITEHNGLAELDALSNNKSSSFTRFVTKIEELAIRAATGCIAVSGGIETYLKEKGAKNTILISNGVSPDFFAIERKDHTNERIKVLYVGTFTPWDGAAYVLKLAEHFKKIEFHFIGDGKLRHEIENANSSENAYFHGFVNYHSLKEEYANYDIGIALYEQKRNTMELSSLKTLEYVASGLPVFSTKVPGQEFIDEEKIGFLTDLDNLTDDFTTFLKSLEDYKQRSDDYRKTTGRRHSWDRTARETEEFIGQLISENELEAR